MAKNNPYALKFNGSNSWVKIPKTTEITPSDQITVMALAYNSDWSSIDKRDIISNFNRGGYGIVCNDTNSGIGFAIYSAYSSSYKNASVPLSSVTNGWHIFTGVYDGSNIIFYVDGVEVAKTPCEGSVSYDARAPLAIGANPSSSGNVDWGYWEGNIDNVFIWDKALTQEEIQYYMNRKLGGDEEGLVGYWSLDEGEGNVAYDLTSNQNHGTVYNAEWIEGEVDLQSYSNILIKSDSKCYTYQSNEFIEVEPTVENFEKYDINLSELTTFTNKVVLAMGKNIFLGEGQTFKKTINMTEFKNKYGLIEKIREV